MVEIPSNVILLAGIRGVLRRLLHRLERPHAAHARRRPRLGDRRARVRRARPGGADADRSGDRAGATRSDARSASAARRRATTPSSRGSSSSAASTACRSTRTPCCQPARRARGRIPHRARGAGVCACDPVTALHWPMTPPLHGPRLRRAASSTSGSSPRPTAWAKWKSTRCRTSRYAARRGVRRPAGTFGFRQIDAAQHPRRPGCADQRAGPLPRHGADASRRSGADRVPPRARGLRLPVLQPDSQSDGAARTSRW